MAIVTSGYFPCSPRDPFEQEVCFKLHGVEASWATKKLGLKNTHTVQNNILIWEKKRVSAKKFQFEEFENL